MYALNAFKSAVKVALAFGEPHLEALLKDSDDPQPVCGLFTKVNFKDDGMEGVVWGIEYISGTFYYAIVPHDLVGDPTNYTEDEFDVQTR